MDTPEQSQTISAPNYRRVEFMTSASKVSQCPPDQGWEVAFAGRSNAGKSSAINSLTDNKKLARTSKTPGRTQLLNFFTLSDQQRLVDHLQGLDHQNPGGLGHGLDDQHPGHHRLGREMPLEKRLVGGDVLDPDGAFILAELLDPVDHQHWVTVREYAPNPRKIDDFGLRLGGLAGHPMSR